MIDSVERDYSVASHLLVLCNTGLDFPKCGKGQTPAMVAVREIIVNFLVECLGYDVELICCCPR